MNRPIDVNKPDPFQVQVGAWLLSCFGKEIAADKIERNHRFLEEALETVQAAGCTESEANQLVAYVYGRPVGELAQEVGGVMNTLAALCLAHGLDMDACGRVELSRCWNIIQKIREKQAAKPKHSPLPEALGDGRPYAADIYIMKLLEVPDLDKYDMYDGLKCWNEGDWKGALEYLEVDTLSD